MKYVLDAVQDRRPVGTFCDADDALQAQEIGAAMLRERLEKQRERHGPDRLIAHERIGRDLGLVPAV